MKNLTLSEKLSEKNLVKLEDIIGTKWIGWNEFNGNQTTVEFVDKTNCIYTSKLSKYTVAYTVMEGNIFINCIEGHFELRGDVLFNNDLPAFEKAA